MRALIARENFIDSQFAATPAAKPASGEFLNQCLAAIKALDSHTFEDTLNRAATMLGAQGLLQRVI
ncbi:MAG TPA: hypothetical protein VKA67_01940, partial [Verrucomicrobiae bacterium]|nr:hypothetical protein [Verrucomicrobiae bacterium]